MKKNVLRIFGFLALAVGFVGCDKDEPVPDPVPEPEAIFNWKLNIANPIFVDIDETTEAALGQYGVDIKTMIGGLILGSVEDVIIKPTSYGNFSFQWTKSGGQPEGIPDLTAKQLQLKFHQEKREGEDLFTVYASKEVITGILAEFASEETPALAGIEALFEDFTGVSGGPYVGITFHQKIVENSMAYYFKKEKALAFLQFAAQFIPTDGDMADIVQMLPQLLPVLQTAQHFNIGLIFSQVETELSH
jgi:hypothetical protein